MVAKDDQYHEGVNVFELIDLLEAVQDCKMRCISPITLRQKGNINHVPCGKCNYCLQKKRDDWSFRISREFKVAKSAYFVTLTYNEENVPIADVDIGDGEVTQYFPLPVLNKRDVQLFLKRLRKYHTDKERLSPIHAKMPQIKYYLCGEYGTNTYRPHYHLIIFNINKDTANKIPDLWGLGHTHSGDVNDATINYTTKYMITKEEFTFKEHKPFSLMSKGLGKSYVEFNRKRHKANKEIFVRQNGYPKPMPRYFKDKIFNKVEKDLLHKKQEIENDKREEDKRKRLQGLVTDVDTYREQQINEAYRKVAEKAKKHNKF